MGWFKIRSALIDNIKQKDNIKYLEQWLKAKLAELFYCDILRQNHGCSRLLYIRNLVFQFE
jgi:hypothetical protein